MAKEHDGWDTGSGLVDEWEGKVVDAYFEYDANFRNGDEARAVLEWALESGPLVIKMGVGADWKIVGDGAGIEHPTKDEVNKNSKYGIFVTTAAKVGRDVLKKRGTSLEAGSWKGLDLGVERGERTFKDKDTGETVEYEVFLCTSVKEGAALTGKEKGEAVQALKARVQAVRDANPDDPWATFVQQVFSEIPEVLSVPEVEEWVADEAIWSV